MTAAPQKLSVSIPKPPPTPNPSPASAPTLIEHRAAVSGKAGGPGSRPVPPAPACRGACRGRAAQAEPWFRDQILGRLWELANLSHEVTRGIIAGQIKALSMIVAIEGLIQPEP